jgi:CPA1 family monovalent cation:H+ antiporter
MVAGANVQTVQAVFLLLLVFVAVFAGLARQLKVPYPILVIAGLLLSVLPRMPRIGLNPDLVFFVFRLRSCIRQRGHSRGESFNGTL